MNDERIEHVRDLVGKMKPYDFDDPVASHTIPCSTALENAENHAPQVFYMPAYHASSECGTLGCIAGATIAAYPIEARQITRELRRKTDLLPATDDVAGEILDIPHEKAVALFHGAAGEADRATPAEAAQACQNVLDGVPASGIWRHVRQRREAGKTGTGTR